MKQPQVCLDPASTQIARLPTGLMLAECLPISFVLTAFAIGLCFPAVLWARDPWRLQIELDNDLPVANAEVDDFYSFGTRIEWSRANWGLRLEEAAFTDRVDKLRFDETYLAVGALLPEERLGGFTVWTEVGLAHVGQGLFGEDAQNEIHKLTGDYAVDLDYLPGVDDYHFHVSSEAGRQWRVDDRWTLGPRMAASVTIDFRSNVFFGLRSTWVPHAKLRLDMSVGSRWADSDLALLKPHLKSRAFAAQVELRLPWHFVVEWSHNRYGTGRNHVAIGCSFGPGKNPRRGGI